jgi:aspartate racemase
MIPLLSIVEATRDKAQSLELKRIGLFGTRFTMTGGFYQRVFAEAGLEIVTPSEAEQNYIHEKYIGELLKNMFAEETRARLMAIVAAMREREQIEALILGGTELPLILRESEQSDIPFLDTTKIHVERIVDELLS